jgi:hypothetical protein
LSSNSKDRFILRSLLWAALSAASLLIVMAVPAGAADAILLGNSSLESSPDNDLAGLSEAFDFRASALGSADGVSVYVDNGSNAQGLTAGLYTDAGGHPGNLLASGSNAAPVAGQWDRVTFDSATTLSSGTSYWLAVLGTGGQLDFRDADSGNSTCSESSARTDLSSLPAIWVGGAAWKTCSLSAYVFGPGAAAPVNQVLPQISGQVQQGGTLAASSGSWDGSPTSYAYQWQECDGSGAGCTNLSGATSSRYELTADDLGRTVRVVVTASNADGATSATSANSAVVASSGSGDVKLQQIDGGPGYFAHFGAASAWMDDHILVGGWLEQPQSANDVSSSVAMGDNFYWNLSDGSVDYDVIRAGGMHLSAPSRDATSGSESVMYDGNDEDDMNFGPGSNGWIDDGIYNQTACIPTGSQCGYTASARTYNSFSPAAVHQGYGKGVLFWDTDAQAAKFLTYTDVPSADSYWMTDTDLQYPSQGGCALLPGSPTACGNGSGSGLTVAQAELPANYEYNVTGLERLDAMNGSSKPVAVDVEVGCPETNQNAGNCVTVPQFTAAAWHALIAGARGIIWFQHSFSGPCVDFRTLMDGSDPTSPMYNCQITAGETLHGLVQGIKAFNAELAPLNDVLLSPTAVGYVNTSADVSATAKPYGGSCYVFAGSGKPGIPPSTNQSVTFNVADTYTGPVSVFDENRTVQAVNGVFRDTFADANAVHIYEISGSSCA